MTVYYDVKIRGIDKLVEGSWAKWKRDVTFAFLEAGLVGYLDGSLKAPTDPKDNPDWLAYNSRIIGTLGRLVDDSLAQELLPDMLAADAWVLLKRRTSQGGIIAKLNAMRAAITTKFSKAKETNITISELRDHLTSIFETGVAPTQDEWFIVLMLNSLDGTEYDWLRKTLVTQFTNSKTTPTSKEIVDAINFANYDNRQESSKDLANALKVTNNSRSKSKPKSACSNCGNRGHCVDDCWSEGGGAHGKAPDWWKKRETDKKHETNKKSKSKDKSKANAATHSDSDDSGIESANAFCDRLADGYISCTAIEGNYDQCSVPWDHNTTAVITHSHDI